MVVADAMLYRRMASNTITDAKSKWLELVDRRDELGVFSVYSREVAQSRA